MNLEGVCGIYGIHNTVSDKWYVGKSIDIATRKYHHFYKLDKGTHDNEHLQLSYDKYGKDSFDFHVLEECTVDSLDDKEMMWIVKMDSRVNGYNMTKGGEGCLGRVVSDETKQKMHIIMSGKNHPCYGKKASDETKRKMSNSRKGEKAYWYGKHRSQKLKDAVSNANKGRPPVNRKEVICIETGEVFPSIRSAAKSVDKAQSCMSRAVNNHQVLAGYHWCFVKEVC